MVIVERTMVGGCEGWFRGADTVIARARGNGLCRETIHVEIGGLDYTA